MSQETYDASAIEVLEGLDPVKQSPGMYTRVTCPTHIIQEVIDNAADEALAGAAKRLSVTVHADGSVTVEDDGRGIPVDIHPVKKRPAIELIFGKLHAGGKFGKNKAGSSYRFSGGLHGVGVSVTNALSTRLEVQVRRDGGIHEIAFADGGRIEKPLTRVGDCGPRTTGSTVRAWPDPKYFDSPRVNLAFLEHLLRSKALLLPGFRVRFTVEGDKPLEREWRFEKGMAGYLEEMAAAAPIAPVYAGEKHISAAEEKEGSFVEGEGAAWAVAWFEEPSFRSESYVNLIPTLEHGTHEAGLRAGIFEAVKSFAEHHSLLPAKIKLTQEDVTGRMGYVLSTRILSTSFQGQTKEKLVSREAYKLVSQLVRDPFELWLNQHTEAGKAIADLAIKTATARQRAADNRVEKRRSSSVATLPGKLTDASSKDPSRTEIFLVEGDSAGGSAKQGRDKEFQAVLPLRGKVLNTWEVDPGQLFRNTEIHDISVAVGIDPHSLADVDKVDMSALRYQRIIIMNDADVDGAHIATLLLTLFARHLPALVVHGHIHLAQPPLYRLTALSKGKAKHFYCLDEDERTEVVEKLLGEGLRESQITTQRFKGLGEMNPEQLWETTLCPDTRRLVRFQASVEELKRLAGTFTMLMAKGESAARRTWMERDGNLVEADI